MPTSTELFAPPPTTADSSRAPVYGPPPTTPDSSRAPIPAGTTDVPPPAGGAGPGGTTNAESSAGATPLPPIPEPTAGAGDDLALYGDQAPGVTDEQTVQGQLGGILDKNNALFDWARGQAGQYSNSRGLMNSDIGIEAAGQAVMTAALPIAQQDAATFADRAAQEAQFYQNAGLAAFEGTINANLMTQDHIQSLVEMAQQGDINSRLQLEQFGYNFDLSVQDNIHSLEQLALQGDINARLALEQFGYDVDLMAQDNGYRLGWLDKELENALALSDQDNTQWIERMGVEHQNTLEEIAAQGTVNGDLNEEAYSRELQQNYLFAVDARSRAFSLEVTTIYSTQGLTAAQQRNAVNLARTRYEEDVAMLGDYYSSSPYWDSNWDTSSPSAAPDTGGVVDPDTPPGGIPPDPVIPPVEPDPIPGDRFERDLYPDRKYPDRELQTVEASPPAATAPAPAPAPAPDPYQETAVPDRALRTRREQNLR